MNLFDYNKSSYIDNEPTAADYNEIFTKEAANYGSFKELEKSIDDGLLPEFNKWAKHIALDKNKLLTLFTKTAVSPDVILRATKKAVK